MTQHTRDHGGGLDAACSKFGGARIGWIDLSTGINPHPYPTATLSPDAWTALPDAAQQTQLLKAARSFWNVPSEADILASPGASALIAQIPSLIPAGRVIIPTPTYNEHAAAFENHKWRNLTDNSVNAQVVVNPNNPDGALWTHDTLPASDTDLTVIDESFCDISPEHSLIGQSVNSGTLVLKSFGKFWGLAGLRLGFAIGDPALIDNLKDKLGPWPVAGPALEIGATALSDERWARETRDRLMVDSQRLDSIMRNAGATVVGGTTLFRLYDVGDAAGWQIKLAEHHIWTRIFPYNSRWIRLGLPHHLHWPRLEAALA